MSLIADNTPAVIACTATTPKLKQTQKNQRKEYHPPILQYNNKNKNKKRDLSTEGMLTKL